MKHSGYFIITALLIFFLNQSHAAGFKTIDTKISDSVITTFSDAFITARVETAVLKAKVLDDQSIPLVGINAATTNGVVTLTGKVKSTQSLTFILKRINTIQGVQKIISQLEIDKVRES